MTAREWSLLRPPECPLRARQRRPNRPCHFVFVCGSCCRFLPTMFWLNRVSSSSLCPGRNPSWDFELGFPRSVLTLLNRCETLAIVVHEVAERHLCHIGVSHWECNRPNWPNRQPSTLPAAKHSPGPPKPPGFHTTAQELQTCTLLKATRGGPAEGRSCESPHTSNHTTTTHNNTGVRPAEGEGGGPAKGEGGPAEGEMVRRRGKGRDTHTETHTHHTHTTEFRFFLSSQILKRTRKS